MAKLLLVIVAVLAMTVSRSDGTVTLPKLNDKVGQGRTTTIDCQITGGETFVAWQTPSKPARGGKPAIPSERIQEGADGRRKVVRSGDNYQLQIEATTVDDGGEYSCIGSSGETKRYTLNVDYNIGSIKYEQTQHLGKTETIELGVSGYPDLTYTWRKDGQQLTFPPGGRLTLNPHTGSITINPVKESDEGNYTCVVSSSVLGSHSFPAISVTIVERPRINKYQGEPVRRRLTQGYNITFHCDISAGRPKPTVSWYFTWDKTSKMVDSQYDSRFSHPTDEEWTTIDVQQKDKGQYRCIAENSAGSDQLKFEITGVDVPPMIDPLLTDIVVDENVNQDLVCKVSGTPTPTVEWLKEGVLYRDQTRSTEGNKVVQTISFTRIQWVSSGKYTCRARSGARDNDGNMIQVEQTIRLDVQSAPRLISQASPSVVYSFVGRTKPVTIACVFYGYPAPLVKMANESSGEEVARGNSSASFTLHTDSNNDFGKFNCSAENSHGREDFSVELKIAVPPGPPRNVVPTATCKDVTLVWVEPETNGGMDISHYIIRVTKDNVQLFQQSIGGDLREVKIDYPDFKADTEYQIYIQAQSEAGYGKEEMYLKKTEKYCVPGRPAITNKEYEVESTFNLIWKRPIYDGGDKNIRYKVECRKKPVTKDTVVHSEDNISETRFQIKDLEGDEVYECKVFARNMAGLGEPDTRNFKVKKGSAVKKGEISLPVEYNTAQEQRLGIVGVWHQSKNANTSSGSPDKIPSGITTFQSTSTPTSVKVTDEPQTIVPPTGESTTLITTTTAIEPEVGAGTQSGIGAGAIAGIVIAVILIVLITIDLFCCFFNSCGVIFCCHRVICGGGGNKKDKYKDGKATEMEKKPLPENV